MRVTLLNLVMTIAITMASPVISSSLLPRSQVCANDGKTKMGTLFTGRDLSPSTLTPRSMPHIPCFWCQGGTQTALSIKAFNPNIWTPADAPVVLKFLNTVLNQVRKQLHTNSDGPIPQGQFHVGEYGANWIAMNTGNHQLTWGVMGAAVEALTNFMVLYGFGPAVFLIYDGGTLVGRAMLEPDH